MEFEFFKWRKEETRDEWQCGHGGVLSYGVWVFLVGKQRWQYWQEVNDVSFVVSGKSGCAMFALYLF